MKNLVLAVLIIMSAGAQAQETGNAAVAASNAGTGRSWDKWIFTGGAAAAVAGGLISLFVTGANGTSEFPPVPTTTSSH